MNAESNVATKEINSFEEYTLFSLERSTPALLRMMERSKRIAAVWPDPAALLEATGLTQEIAALADFQNALQNALGDNEKTAADKQREEARQKLLLIMDSMEDILNLSDLDVAKRMFSVDLPEALNCFMEAIPLICGHIREQYINGEESTDPAVSGDG